MENDILDALEDLGYVLNGIFIDLLASVQTSNIAIFLVTMALLIVHVYMYFLIRELQQLTVQCFEQIFNIVEFLRVFYVLSMLLCFDPSFKFEYIYRFQHNICCIWTEMILIDWSCIGRFLGLSKSIVYSFV